MPAEQFDPSTYFAELGRRSGEARRRKAAMPVEDRIAELIENAPPLTAEQRAKLGEPAPSRGCRMNAEGRPGKGGPRMSQRPGVDTSMVPPEGVGSQLRRRAVAARRLPTYHDDAADGALTDRDPMLWRGRRRPGKPQLDVTIVTTHTAVVRGKYVHRALQRAACPAQYQHHPPDDGVPPGRCPHGPPWRLPPLRSRWAVRRTSRSGWWRYDADRSNRLWVRPHKAFSGVAGGDAGQVRGHLPDR